MRDSVPGTSTTASRRIAVATGYSNNDANQSAEHSPRRMNSNQFRESGSSSSSSSSNRWSLACILRSMLFRIIVVGLISFYLVGYMFLNKKHLRVVLVDDETEIIDAHGQANTHEKDIIIGDIKFDADELGKHIFGDNEKKNPIENDQKVGLIDEKVGKKGSLSEENDDSDGEITHRRRSSFGSEEEEKDTIEKNRNLVDKEQNDHDERDDNNDKSESIVNKKDRRLKQQQGAEEEEQQIVEEEEVVKEQDEIVDSEEANTIIEADEEHQDIIVETGEVHEDDKKYLNEEHHEPEVHVEGVLPAHIAHHDGDDEKEKSENVVKNDEGAEIKVAENKDQVDEEEQQQEQAEQNQDAIEEKVEQEQEEEEEEEEEEENVDIEKDHKDLLPSFELADKVNLASKIEDEEADNNDDDDNDDVDIRENSNELPDCESVRLKTQCDDRGDCKWLKPKSETKGFFCASKIILPCTHSKFSSKSACEAKKGCAWVLPTPTSKYHKCLSSDGKTTTSTTITTSGIASPQSHRSSSTSSSGHHHHQSQSHDSHKSSSEEGSHEPRLKSQCKYIYIRTRCMARNDCTWKYPTTQKVGRYCSKATKEELEARAIAQATNKLANPQNATEVKTMIPIFGDLEVTAVAKDTHAEETHENVAVVSGNDDGDVFGINQMMQIVEGSKMFYDEPVEPFNFAGIDFGAKREPTAETDDNLVADEESSDILSDNENEIKDDGSWKSSASDISCSMHKECGDPTSQVTNITKYFTGQEMISFRPTKCCENHVHLRIMMHAVSDFFNSVGFSDWWLGSHELVGMEKHYGILLPYQHQGVINFAIRGGASVGALNVTMQSSHSAFVNEMTKFNEQSKYLPYVLKACASKFPPVMDHSSTKTPPSYDRSWLQSSPADLKCQVLSKSSPISKSRTVQFFILTHMDEPLNHDNINLVTAVFIIPRLVRGNCVETWRHSKNCERMISTPTKWILPTIPCPYPFYGKEMRCPKWMEQYLDVNSDNWRESGHGSSIQPPLVKSSTSASKYIPITWTQHSNIMDIHGKDTIFQTRQWLIDNYCPISESVVQQHRAHHHHHHHSIRKR